MGKMMLNNSDYNKKYSILSDIKNCMRDDGYLITFVPSWTCERWRAGIHKESRGYNDHAWTFALLGENVPQMDNTAFIDNGIEKSMNKFNNNKEHK